MEGDSSSNTEGMIVYTITVEDILKQHELSEYLDIMKQADINSLELFSLIAEEDIKSIVNKTGIEAVGIRARFRAAINQAKLLTSIPVQTNDAEVTTSQAPTKKIRLEDVLIPNADRIDLETILQGFEGLKITEFVRQKGAFDNLHRGKLVSCILKYLLVNVNPKALKMNWFKAIFDEIKKKFPAEEKYESIYYTKFTYAKYNITRNLRDNASADGASTSSSPIQREIMIYDVSEEDAKKAKTWLDQMREPWPMVVENWKRSFQLRLALYNSTNRLVDLWADDNWSILKMPQALELIKIDFQTMFPEVTTDVCAMWPVLKEKVFKYADENLRNKQHKQNIELFRKNKTDDLLFIKIMSACLSPGNVTQKFRPTFEESLNSFVREVKTTADVETALDKYRASLREHHLTLQPHVILINGHSKQYLVYLDQGRYYTVDGLLVAIDSVIKLCMTLNVHYTWEARPLWVFLQKFCYGIDTKNDPTYACLNNLMSHISD